MPLSVGTGRDERAQCPVCHHRPRRPRRNTHAGPDRPRRGTGFDAESLRQFYAEVFDWQREDDRSIGAYPVGSLGAIEVTAATQPVPEWGVNAAKFYIQVDDVDATLDHIERLGGRRVMPKQVGPPDFPSPHINVFTKFIDPAGNVVGLVERVG